MNKSLYLRKLKNLREQVDMLLKDVEDDGAIKDAKKTLVAGFEEVLRMLYNSLATGKINEDFYVRELEDAANTFNKIVPDFANSPEGEDLRRRINIGIDQHSQPTAQNAMTVNALRKAVIVLDKASKKANEVKQAAKVVEQDLTENKGEITKYAYGFITIGVLLGVLFFPSLKNNFKEAFSSFELNMNKVMNVLKAVGEVVIIALPLMLGVIMWLTVNKPEWFAKSELTDKFMKATTKFAYNSIIAIQGCVAQLIDSFKKEEKAISENK